MTAERFVACSICAKSFVPRFTYQTEANGGAIRHFCSIACRAPELGRARAPSTSQASQHACAACGKRFEIRFAYQVVAAGRAERFGAERSDAGQARAREGGNMTGKTRRVVCSEPCRVRVLEEERPKAPPARPAVRTIAVLNQKGGTGKTTTAVSIAAGLAARGERTLLCDLDAQGNVGVSLGVESAKTLYHVLADGARPRDVAVSVRGNLDVIVSDHQVAQAEIALVSAPDRVKVLSRRMAETVGPESPYTFVVLDCAPSLSLLNQNALIFAKEVLVPVSCDYLALVGVKQILRTLRHVNEVLLHPVEVAGVLPTFYDVRNKISKQAIDALAGYFKGRVLPPIRVNARLKEAPIHKKTIFEYAPDSHGAEDYAAAVSWLLGGAGRAEALAYATAGAPLIRFAPEV
jgi:chromosome partitioning protein